MKMKALLLCSFAALVLAGCGNGERPASTSATPSPWVAVARGEVAVEGGLLQVRPAVPGVVSQVAVHSGDRVHAGQMLVRLNDEAVRIAVRLAQAEVDQAKARSAELAAGLPAAQQRERRLAAAAAVDAASGQELADARAALAEMQARAAAATAAERAALARLDAERYTLAQYTIRAATNGRVAGRFVQVGARVAPQDHMPMLDLLPDRPLLVQAELSQTYADRVHPGLRAVVVLEGGGAQQWPAHVLRLGVVYGAAAFGPTHEQPDDAHDLPCVLQLDAPGLRVGQRVLVRFLPGKAPP